MMLNKLLLPIFISLALIGISRFDQFAVQAQGDDSKTLGPWGQVGDLPIAGDFNADSLDDLGFFRPSTGHWYFDINGDAYEDYAIDFTSWGQEDDLPITGDFNGDGRDGIGFFRPSVGIWYFDYDLDGISDYQITWGAVDDNQIPFAGDFDNDGDDDIALFSRTGAIAFYDPQLNFTTGLVVEGNYGSGGYYPIAGYFNNDEKTDLGFVQISSGEFAIDWNMDGQIDAALPFNESRDYIYVMVGDFDGNGWSDLVELGRSSLMWTIRFRGERILNPIPSDATAASSPSQTVTFKVEELTVIDGEEDATSASSGQDEAYLVYFINVFERSSSENTLVNSVKGTWGVMELQAGQTVDSSHFDALTTIAEAHQTVEIVFMLLESERDNAANYLISGEWLPEWEMFGEDTIVGDNVQRILRSMNRNLSDEEDILGVRIITMNPVSNYTGQFLRTFNISGENNLDTYEYSILYTVKVE